LSLIKQKHQKLFEKKVLDLLTDLGDVVIIYLQQIKTVCAWCELDSATDRSSGIPKTGVDWETHANYKGNTLRCPECFGVGYTITWDTITLSKTHIEDISGETYVKGKVAYFPAGTKRVTGLISDVEVGGNNYLEIAKKLVIGGNDYKLYSYEKLGIKSDYIFRAIVERTNIIEV